MQPCLCLGFLCGNRSYPFFSGQRGTANAIIISQDRIRASADRLIASADTLILFTGVKVGAKHGSITYPYGRLCNDDHSGSVAIFTETGVLIASCLVV